jgi:hypothetical protein
MALDQLWTPGQAPTAGSGLICYCGVAVGVKP